MPTAHETPEYRYRCEARIPGKKPHVFACVNGDTARALCDAMGWELIRVWEPGGDSDRPASAATAAPRKGDPPLTGVQIRAVNAEARKSWNYLRDLGVDVPDTYDGFRHEQVNLAVKQPGLTRCANSHYRRLLSHFRRLRGVAAATAPQTGKWSGEAGDTQERRLQLLRLIATELGAHNRRVDKPATPQEVTASAIARSKGGAVGIPYLLAVARAKNPGITIADEDALIVLASSRLEHLLSTMRNRIAAREGRGETRNRDKKQRGGG